MQWLKGLLSCWGLPTIQLYITHTHTHTHDVFADKETIKFAVNPTFVHFMSNLVFSFVGPFQTGSAMQVRRRKVEPKNEMLTILTQPASIL